MTEKSPITLGALIASEALAGFGIPGGATFSTLIGAYLEKRRREAITVLIDEFSNGYHGRVEFLPEDADDLIQIIHRFSKAVEDGCARENLKLLAQVIAGQKKNKALDPDAFLKWAHSIADLTRSELLLVGISIVVKTEGHDQFWTVVKKRMEEGGFSEDECMALASSVARTGLLLPVSAFSSLNYHHSPWLSELEQLVDVEELLKAQEA